MKSIPLFATIVRTVLILPVIGIMLGVLPVHADVQKRPNMIFILCDDLAQGDLGCYGQRLIKTPHLDAMAATGTRFTQTYCGTTVCAPSRTSLMTGLHTGHSPIRANWEIAPGEGQLPLPQGSTTIASVLKQSGYATACMGKWGMGMFHTSGSPLKQGFDHFFGYNCQRHAHSYFPEYLYRDDVRFELPGNNGKTVGQIYAQELIQNEVESWLRAHSKEPFFLFYAITLPHGRAEIDRLGIYEETDWSEQEKTYAAQVSRLDTDTGRVLNVLKELGLDQQTLVMISGDNGSSYNASSELGKKFNQSMSGKLRGFKRTMYEGGLRQACIASWPGVVPAGRVCDEPWAFWDILPTAAELGGSALPTGYQPDGHSLVTMLQGGSAPQRDYFYWELHEGAFIQAVRFGDWKAVRNGPAKPIELYNLANDEGETKDLAANHPDLITKAQKLLTEARVDDPNWPIFENAKEQKLFQGQQSLKYR